jgi:hypothetical protein
VTSDGARDLARAVRGLADRLPERLGPLASVAYNYRWSWTPGGEALFRSLDPMRFERCRGNPVRLLHQLSAKVLEDAARDDDFLVAAAELQATIADDLFATSLSREWSRPSIPSRSCARSSASTVRSRSARADSASSPATC